MNTLFRLSKVYLFVIFFLNTLHLEKSFAQSDGSASPTQGYGFPMVSMECSNAQTYFSNSISKLADKCGGAGIGTCVQEAEKCSRGDFSPSGSGGVESIVNNLTPMIGSSLGFPLQPAVGGVNGGANTDFFTCMPTIKRDNYMDQLKEIKSDTKKYYDEANRDLKDIKDDLKDIRTTIFDKKAEMLKSMKDVQEIVLNSPVLQKKISAQAMDEYSEANDNIVSMQIELADLRSKKQEDERNLQDLYYDVFADPRSSCKGAYDSEFSEYKKTVDKNTYDFKVYMGRMTDIYDMSSAANNFKKDKNASFNEFKLNLNKKYGDCLELKKREYQKKYNAISVAIQKQTQELRVKEDKINAAMAKLKEIPKTIALALDAEKKKVENAKQNWQTELQQAQDFIKTTSSDYESRLSEAMSKQKIKEMGLQMAQMKIASAQAAFQYTAFGDAAPLINARNSALDIMCSACENSKKAAYETVSKCKAYHSKGLDSNK